MIRRILSVALLSLALVGCAGFITQSGHNTELYGHAEAAADAGDTVTLRTLLDQTPGLVNEREWDDRTLLLDSANHGRDETVNLLLSRGADVNAHDKDGRTALHVAAQNGHSSTIEILLGHGADLNRRDKFGWTALDRARKWHQSEAVKSLLSHGAVAASAD